MLEAVHEDAGHVADPTHHAHAVEAGRHHNPAPAATIASMAVFAAAPTSAIVLRRAVLWSSAAVLALQKERMRGVLSRLGPRLCLALARADARVPHGGRRYGRGLLPQRPGREQLHPPRFPRLRHGHTQEGGARRRLQNALSSLSGDVRVACDRSMLATCTPSTTAWTVEPSP